MLSQASFGGGVCHRIKRGVRCPIVRGNLTTGYAHAGRIGSAGFLHKGVQCPFSYSYLPGSKLLQSLSMPNNMSLTQSYESQRDLLTEQRYKRGSGGVAERSYTYNALGAPVTRRTARQGTVREDSFGYNERSELTAATLGTIPYAYDYDNIGNRKTAQENAEEVTYTANALNQYTQIDTDGSEFIPEYDADGNQTLIRTSTGIWSAEYNAQNRAIRYTRENADGTRSVITADYDYMGRRVWKKVESITPNPETGEETTTVTLHHRYIYRGYLQIATCDLTRTAHPCLWLITWDPTQPIATRPLAIQKDSTWYCYGWDLTKNICEIYSTGGYIHTVYTYTPYGEVTASGNVTQSPRGLGGGLDKPKGFAPQGRGRNGVRPSQPIQWSSEYADTELGLVYYNYRYYNPTDGTWISHDPLEENATINLYEFNNNSPITIADLLGLKTYISQPGCNIDEYASACTCNLKCRNKKSYTYFCYCHGKGRAMPEYSSRITDSYTTGIFEGSSFIRYWCCTKYDRGKRTPQYEPVMETERESAINGEVVATATAAAGVGYLVYRAVRLIPSLLPPLWGTIPANLAIP